MRSAQRRPRRPPLSLFLLLLLASAFGNEVDNCQEKSQELSRQLQEYKEQTLRLQEELEMKEAVFKKDKERLVKQHEDTTMNLLKETERIRSEAQDVAARGSSSASKAHEDRISELEQLQETKQKEHNEALAKIRSELQERDTKLQSLGELLNKTLLETDEKEEMWRREKEVLDMNLREAKTALEAAKSSAELKQNEEKEAGDESSATAKTTEDSANDDGDEKTEKLKAAEQRIEELESELTRLSEEAKGGNVEEGEGQEGGKSDTTEVVAEGEDEETAAAAAAKIAELEAKVTTLEEALAEGEAAKSIKSTESDDTPGPDDDGAASTSGDKSEDKQTRTDEPEKEGQCIGLQEHNAVKGKVQSLEESLEQLKKEAAATEQQQPTCQVNEEAGPDRESMSEILHGIRTLGRAVDTCQSQLSTVKRLGLSRGETIKTLAAEISTITKLLDGIKANRTSTLAQFNVDQSGEVGVKPNTGDNEGEEEEEEEEEEEAATTPTSVVSMDRIQRVLHETEDVMKQMYEGIYIPTKEQEVITMALKGVVSLEDEVAKISKGLQAIVSANEPEEGAKDEETPYMKVANRAMYVLAVVVVDLVLFQMLLPKGSRCLILVVVILWAWVSYLAFIAHSWLLCALCMCNCVLALCYVCNPNKEEKFITIS